MLDGRFHLNSSPLGTFFKLLFTISFSDSVDKLDDELDENEYEEGYLFLFSRLDFDFFRLVLLERFTISGLDEGEFLFLFLDLCGLSSFFVGEVSRFLIPSLLAHHMSSLQLYLYAETQHLSNFLTLFTVSNMYP